MAKWLYIQSMAMAITRLISMSKIWALFRGFSTVSPIGRCLRVMYVDKYYMALPYKKADVIPSGSSSH